MNGGDFVPFTASPTVNALAVFTDPYYTNRGTLTATGSTAGLVISNFTAGGDSAVLVDDFRIVATPTFTHVPIVNLPQVGRGSVAWGDCDNDGGLDFLLTGFNGSSFVSQLWRNNTLATNTTPTAPTGLAMTATTKETLNKAMFSIFLDC